MPSYLDPTTPLLNTDPADPHAPPAGLTRPLLIISLIKGIIGEKERGAKAGDVKATDKSSHRR